MLTKIFKYIVNFINNLDSFSKNALISLLLGMIIMLYINDNTKSLFKSYYVKQQQDRELAEEYTDQKSYEINQQIENILLKDTDATHVILLNYHNTLSSTNGLSYKYLTILTEKRRGQNTKSCFKYWKDLEYFNYGDEIETINTQRYLTINDVEKSENSFPNFADLLEESRVNQASFFPIIGINGPIGMIVVMYNNKKVYDKKYYATVISPSIQLLASLLDYNNVKNLNEK